MTAPLKAEGHRRVHEESEARQKRRPPKGSAAPKVILGILAIVAIVLIAASLAKKSRTTSTPPPTPSASGVKTVRGTYWCAASFEDAGRIGSAATRGDTATLAEMKARGAAYQVEEGSRVAAGGESNAGISLVQVESGSQAGRKCYIATDALK